MPPLVFDHSAILLLAAVLVALFFLRKWGKRYPSPRLLYSTLSELKRVATGWRSSLAQLPRWLFYTALALFILAFINPERLVPYEGTEPPQSQPVAGIALYLLLDQSGSMADPVTLGNREKIAKIELLKELTTAFVKGDPALGLPGRPNDMIGIVALARGAKVLSPLTLDHKAILESISHLSVLSSPEEGGTVIGYALFKTANLIAATRHYAEQFHIPYTIKSNVIVLVTDGLQDPNPADSNKPLRTMDIPEATDYARQVGVRVYIVDIDPVLGKEEFAAARGQMERAAESTGGKYYLVQGAKGLAQIYAEIDRLEKSPLPSMEEKRAFTKRVGLYPFFVAFGIAALFAALLLSTTVLKRVP